MERLKGKSLLLVDDETDLIKVLSWDFEDIGMNVILANSGNEAIQKIKDLNSNLDFIVSDIKMPNGDGVELLAYVTNNKVKVKAFFLMTGYTDYPENELIERGMKRLIKKPVDSDILMEFLISEL